MEGVITDAVTTDPINGALVSLGQSYLYTGADGAYAFTTNPGQRTVTVEKPGYAAQSQTFTAVVNETEVLNFAMEEEANPPVGVFAEELPSNVVNISWGAPGASYEIIYDDGTAENYAVWAQGGNMNALRFTPAGYPCDVLSASIYVGDGTYPQGEDILQPFEVAVYDDNGTNGFPGTELGRVTITPAQFGWLSADLSDLAVTIESGDFYIVMIQGGNYPECLAVGVNETAPSVMRSYSRNATNGQGWTLAGYTDFMMRAVCEGPAGVVNMNAGDFVEASKPSIASLSMNPPVCNAGEVASGTYRGMENGDAGRGFNNYSVYRLLHTDIYTPENWTLLGNTSNLNYRDNSWPTLDPGLYHWAVVANYTNNASEPGISNFLSNEFDYEVTVEVTTTDGSVPVGALVTMTSQAHNTIQYQDVCDETGTVVFTGVWNDTYDLSVVLVGYDIYEEEVVIDGNMTLEVLLGETLAPPRALYVDGQTLHATWVEPGSFQAYEVDFNDGFPEDLEVNDIGGCGGWFLNAAYSGFTTQFARIDSDANGNGCNDIGEMITPALNAAGVSQLILEFDQYYYQLGSQYADVDVWDGSQWVNLRHQTATIGSWASPNHQVIDLTPYANAQLKVRFYYNDGNGWNWYWAVDNIKIWDGITDTRGVVGYNFFLTEDLLLESTQNTYLDIPPYFVTWGTEYTSGVNAVYPNGVSPKVYYTWTASYLAPPRNLEGEADGHYAHLMWDPPVIEEPAFEGTFPTVAATGNTSREIDLGRAPSAGTPSTASPDLFLNRGSIAYGTDAINNIFGSIDVEFPATMTQISTFTGDIYCGDFGVEDQNMFYVIDNSTSQLKVVDITTGVFTTVGTVSVASGHTWTGMAMDKNAGIMYAASTDGAVSTIYTIDLTSGVSTTIGNPAIAGIIDIAIDGNGVMYATDIVSDESFTIDVTTAVATSIGALGIDLNYAQGLAWDPATDVVYIAAYTSTAQLYILDRSTGAAGLVGNFPAGSEICAFGFQGGGSGGGFVPENLIAYNIYRNGTYYAQVAAEVNEYTSDYLVAGWHSFTVTAVYGDPTAGESGPALPGPADIYILGQGTLTGTVSACGTLPTPIAGAVVTAIDEETGDAFTAVSGNNGVYSMDVTEATYTITCEAEDFETQSVENIFVPDMQTVEVNFDPCEFPYPAIGVTAVRNNEHTQVDVDWYAPMFFGTLAYDDGAADDVTAWDKAANINALRMTPASYPCEVMGAAVNIYDGSWPAGNTTAPFQIAVFDDNGVDGMPGQMLKVMDVTPSANGWVEVFFDDAVVVNDGEFYVAMIQGGDYPNCAPIAIDNSSSEMRSVSRYVTSNEAWKTANFQNFMMRAYVYNEAETRELEKYEVYRLLQGQEELPELWTMLSNNVTETEYVDYDWDMLPQGWYRYAVKAVYTYNVSEAAFSNSVPNGFDSEITINVRDEDGNGVEGAYVVLESETNPDVYSYAATTPNGGSVYFHEVWNGMYKLTVTKEGYTDYILGGIWIQNDNTFNVILQSLCLPPQNFTVNAQTGVATWLPPVVEYEVVFEEGFEGGVIPPGWTQQYLLQNVSWNIGNGGPTGVPADPHSGQYNATYMGSSAKTKLITPPINLAGALVPKVSFWHTQKGGAGQDELRVYYRTSSTGGWVALASYVSNIEVWKNESLALPNPTGTYYIAFEGQAPEPAGMGIALDDIQVMKGINPTADSRALLGFNLYLDGVYEDYTTDYSYTFTGLEVEQTYIAGITAEYTACTSVMVNYAFTYMPCYLFEPPTNFVGVANPGNQVVLTWDLPAGLGAREATIVSEQPRTNVNPNTEGSPTVREIEVTGGTRDMFDLQFSFACGDASGEAGAETDGAKIYTTKWNGSATLGLFFSYELDGTFNGAFEISGCGNIRDLAYDGQYFYGSDATSKFWQMDFDAQTLVGTITAPGTVRAIAYDSDLDAFYINDWSTNVQLVDRSGAVLNSWPVGTYGSFYGMAYDNYDEEAEPSVWCFSQDGSGGIVVQNNAASGAWTGMMWDVVGQLAVAGTDMAGGLYTHENMIAGTTTLGGIIQNSLLFGYELYSAGGGGGGTGFLGFNVYRDGLKLTGNPISALGYNEQITPGGEYTYNVTAVYEPNFESCPEDAEVTLCVGCDLEAPQCIYAEVMESDVDVLVTWCTPGAVTPEYWISYFTDLTHLSWSAPERATLYNVADFGATYPVEVTQLAHLFYEHPSYPWGADITFRFKVYATDGTTVLYESAEVPAQQYPTETIVVLDEAIAVNGDFYVSVAPNPETGMPSSAGIEDLTNSHSYVGEAGAWTAYEIEWASRVKIRTTAGEVALQHNTSGHAVNHATRGETVALDTPITNVTDLNRSILLGYNVWRNGDAVAYVPAPDTSYQDMNLTPDTYSYCVTAIYDEGESTPICAEPVTVNAKGILAGTVYDGVSGTVMQGATLTVGEYTATTGYDGSYEMVLPSGTWEVMAEKAGFAPKVKTATIYYDQTTVLDFNLYPDGVVFTLPFMEPWDGGFEEQNWTFDPEEGNWQVNAGFGVPAPAAEFYWSPSVEDYNFALVSPQIDGEGVENIALSFDLYLSDYSSNGLEHMGVEVFNGTEWMEVADFANTGNIEWESYLFDISEYAVNALFQVRFVAYGSNTFDINYWDIDNVKIYERLLADFYGQVTVCQGGAPVENAMITVGDYDPVYTDADGYYNLQVEFGTYNVSCEFDGYNVVTATGVVVEEDFEWNVCLTQPTMEVNPLEIYVDVIIGTTHTELVTVTNNGDGQLNYNTGIDWISDNDVVIPPVNPDYPRLNVPVSIGVAPEAINLTGYVEEPVELMRGSLAYAFDAYPGTYGFHQIDTDAPGNPIVINPVPNWSAFAGDFSADNETIIYVIDADDSNLKAVDVMTGEATVIGYASAQGGQSWTGLACDKSSGIMYAVSTDVTQSTLYTIDLGTGATTVIGNTGVEGIIDMAIDGTGTLYANCIVNDAIFIIDKETAASTYLGQTGYDANYAQGMAWDPATDIIYLAAYGASGELRILDRNTGATSLIGAFAGGAEVTVFGFPGRGETWLTLEPTSGAVAAMSTADVQFIFDPTGYTPDIPKIAEVTFRSNPNIGTETVYVEMTPRIGITEFAGVAVNVYPNPAKEYVNVELSEQVQSFRILNTVGQVVYDQMATETFFQVDVQNYEAGAYLIEFTTNDGVTFNKRFVVTK
ncbi:MAG: carboxypeptidase regulatory-like domain-containing protein [Bacteroidales bacterium]|nr:carboxypeptidase regulatory-like domain-containing protein [Bacteroidales bacterium]